MPLLFSCFAEWWTIWKWQKNSYKALKIIINSNKSLDELLLDSNEMSIHPKHLQQLTTEIYKSLTDLSPESIHRFS